MEVFKGNVATGTCRHSNHKGGVSHSEVKHHLLVEGGILADAIGRPYKVVVAALCGLASTNVQWISLLLKYCTGVG